ncbi:MAG: hypothetical protein Q9174_004211, partial [Haloplaca sp. 1 TL-2023]
TRVNRSSIARVRPAGVDADSVLVWAEAENTFAGLAFLEEGAVFKVGFGVGSGHGKASGGEGEGQEEGGEEFHRGGRGW